ncbi:DUF7124 domain-containing protein [Halorubrum tibetense]|uniref:DUF7124 domain-containing protein n=1 Tax=Halorubrum tibetense TaxID=175631 RepID=A0ABD5SB72_9EURY
MSVVTTDPDSGGELTLLFSLGAVRSLSDPAAAVTDAREWSRYVGVIANDANAVDRFCRRHGIENDYALRDWDKTVTTGEIREATDTPRHVFVGTSDADRRLATDTGWEYRSIEEAAEKAGWTLGDPADRVTDTDAGPFERIRRWIHGLLP